MRASLLLLFSTTLALPGCLSASDADGTPGEDGSGTQDIVAANGTPGNFFTYNVCGADAHCKVADPTAAVVDNVVRTKPVAFVLQELCSGQANEISRALRAKGLHYVQRFQNATSHLVNLGCGGPEGWGNAVFHVGDALGEVEEKVFESQGSFWSRAQNRSYVCVHVPSPSFWACSTHIDVAEAQQKAQIDELRGAVFALANPAGKAHVPVMVGGDFNVVPESDHIDGMFAARYARGAGIFVENDVGLDRKTLSAPTEGGKKIDYVFHTSDIVTTKSTVVVATSDHKLVANELVFPP